MNQGVWNRTATASDFYIKNINRFKEVREERLTPFVKDYTPAKTGYKELTAVPERIRQDTLSRTYVYPEQWENTIQVAGIQEDNAAEMAKNIQLNAFFGSGRYVKQIDEDNWEVWAVNDTDRIYYIWNTYTGQITQPRYWIKE